MGKGRISLIIGIWLLVVSVTSYWLVKIHKVDLSEPELKTYSSDERMYLKTFYLMEKGEGFYQAFNQANEGVTGGRIMKSDVFTWRWPTLFYLWKLVSNQGQTILYAYWFLALSALSSGFLLLLKFTKPVYALFGPLLLAPYLIDNFSYPTSFLFTEWWGWFFLMFGLTLFIYQKKKAAWVWLGLAILTRELILVPIFALGLVALWQRKDRLYFTSLMLLFFGAFYLHQLQVSALFSLDKGALSLTTSSFLSRLSGFNKLALLKMMAFSTRQYPGVLYHSNWWLVILALGSFIINVWKNLKDKDRFYLLAPGWFGLIILPCLTSNPYNDYWGIVFMPFLILTIPLLTKA